MTAQLQVKNVADTNIDHTEEPLVPSLKLALVEYLDGDHGRVFDRAESDVSSGTHPT